MLRPSKHAHPDQTIVSVSLLLLSHLQENRIEGFDALRAITKKRVKGGEVLFLPALNLLFLLGVVEYQPKTDAFEFRGPSEAK